MKKIINWIMAVIANSHKYATMAGIDIKKSSDRLFEKDASEKNN